MVAAVAALVCDLLLALRTYGSDDVYYWQYFADTYRQFGAIGLYHQVEIFNHPPCMVHVLALLDYLARTVGPSFQFWLRVPAIVAEVVNFPLMWLLLRDSIEQDELYRRLLLLALCPASLMIAGFHGNTDPVMIVFVLVAILLASRQQSVWLAGAAFGMSMNVKVAPLILVPSFFFYLRGASQRGQFFLAAAAVWMAASLPYLAQDPHIIVARVFGYTSLYGHWGLPRLFSALRMDALSALYWRFGRHFVLGVVTLLAWLVNRGERRPPLLTQCGFTMFAFMALTPGFGVQYLSWLVPFSLDLGVLPTLTYYASSGVFLFLVYTYWSGGLPWYYANSLDKPDWPLLARLAELVCWLCVTWMAGRFALRCWAKTDADVEVMLADTGRRQRLQWLALLLVVVGGIWLRWCLNDVTQFSRADESIYLEYVTTLRDHGGPRHYDALVDWYLSDSAMWRYPTPYRYGYILADYAVASLTHDFTDHALGTVSTCCSIGLFVIAVAMARGAGGLPLALVCGTLLLVSPLQLAIGRRALSDMPLAFATLAMLWALHAASRHKSNLLSVLAAVAVMLMLSVQERGVLAILALLPWLLTRPRFERRWPLREFIIIGAGCLGYYLGFCVLSHSFVSMFNVVARCMSDVSLNQYCVLYQNGPFYAYLINLVAIMPVVMMLFPLGLYLLYAQEWSSSLLRYMASFALGFLGLMLVGCACTEGAFFNLRYILSLDAPLCLCVSLGLVEMVRRAVEVPWAWRVGSLATLLVANVALEWHIFYVIFVQQGVYDPISVSLFRALRMLP